MGKSSTALRIAASLLFAIFVSHFTLAQQITGTIRGTIIDPNGAVITGATVSATQVETGLIRSAAADRQGNYVLLELPVGHYQLQVQSKDLQKFLRQGITLN